MGGLSGPRKEAGYVLLDVLAALLIVLIGLSVFVGGISLAASFAARHAQKVQTLIEERNEDAEKRTDTFQKE